MDDIPTYKKGDDKKYTFSGKRIHRGLYRSKNGTLLNADINGAANILRKINFKFYAAENDLGTPPAILWVPMYPWMLNEKEKGITESDLYDFCRKYMDELEIYCDPEEMELEYYS